MKLRVGVLTISDRVSSGEAEDAGGPAVKDALVALGYEIAATAVVPDEIERISQVLTEWSDDRSLDVVFTTGGTGLGPRDVTPEATASVCERLVLGIAEALRRASSGQTPYAMLSRAMAGVRGRTLIINLPGSPKGAAEGVEVVQPVLEHAVDTLRGGRH